MIENYTRVLHYYNLSVTTYMTMTTTSAVENVGTFSKDDTAGNQAPGDWGDFLSKSVAALNIKKESPMMKQCAKQPSSPWSSTIITMPPILSPEEHGEYINVEDRSQKNEMTEYPLPPKLQRYESNAHAHFPENNDYAVDGHPLSPFLADNDSPSTTNVSFFDGNTFSSSLYGPMSTEDSLACPR